MNEKLPTEYSPLKEQVLGRITSEGITPAGKWQFLCREYSMWVAWAVSVVLGAFSMAVIVYTLTVANYEFFEATHESYWSFLISVLPYIWFALLILMAYLAYLNFRNTKSGYRYPLWFVLVSSVSVSLLGGYALHAVGFGHTLDKVFDENMPMFSSFENKERLLWLNPGEGRLLGIFLASPGTSTKPRLLDELGTVWVLDIDDLHELDIETLESQKLVRVLGFTFGDEGNRFHACGVFPWMLEDDVSFEHMSRERNEFLKRMYSHKEMVNELVEELEYEVYSSTSERMPMGICATHAVVGRIEKVFR